MGILDLAALVVTLAAVFAYLNHRFLRLPAAIGVMLLALAASLGLLLAGTAVPPAAEWGHRVLARMHFSDTVLEGMLSFLLFAGALFVNLEDLARQKWLIAGLASIGVVTSTLLVAAGTWLVLGGLGVELTFLQCLLFGALISPTDPLAVLGILKSAGVPRSLETKIVGESLFNDGVAVVVFLVLLEAARHGAMPAGEVATLFAREAVGGAAFGLALGGGAYALLRSLDNYQVEILITLAVVMGGYALAHALHLSGPLAMVVAGLLLGNRGRVLAMSEHSREHLDTFWELMDEMLNVVLFVLIGLEVLALSFGATDLLAGALLIPVVLAARLASVSLPVALLKPLRNFSPGAVRILTWGGLRGGISVALALSLPAGDARDLLLPATYVIVLFSLVVQGLTVGRVARRLAASDGATP